MGAQTSAQPDEKSQEDASAEELSAEVNAISEGDSVVDAKLQQTNGQISISSLIGKVDEQTELHGHSEDNTLTEEVDGVSVSQKEEVPETMDSLQAEVPPQVNGEKDENESPDTNNITSAEEKEVEEKPGEANEVGFKKIFKFVGFKFTVKKDKNEKTEPVQLLTVKDKDVEEGETSGSEETKEEATTTGEEVKSEKEKATEPDTSTIEADATPVDAPSETVDGEAAEAVREEAAEGAAVEATEKEPEDQAATNPPGQETTQSPFRRFFTQGIFFNLRKKASIKKPKEEEPKEKAAEEELKEGEETAEDVVEEDGEKAKEEVEGEVKEVEPVTTPEEAKPDYSTETETVEAPVKEIKEEVQVEVAVEMSEAGISDNAKPAEEKVEEAVEADNAPVEVNTEAELLSSQEKVKAQGSPLKKLFTGAGLKKLSTKKQKKDKKDAEAKLTESGEQAAELQTSTDSAEVQKPDSGASSPEESGEHAIGVESAQAEASQEADGEVTSSDEGKKKEGIMPWSSFKKLVTPKKRIKRPSESEDEATGEKAKSGTLSSTESAVFVEKEKEKEPEPTEEDPKTETTEKLEGSTEESKRMKMDTSVSWEALMCMGGNKKRTRKTSDSEDEDTKIEEEAPQAGEEPAKTAESPLGSSREADQENTVSSPEPSTSPAAGESPWDTLKRLVTHRKKPKAEEKTDESGAEPVVSDSEISKEDSSFSLRKLIPGRRKKKQLSSDLGSGEEDSDTPAVVPLSEYDNEHAKTKEEAEFEMTVETVDAKEAARITQAQSSTEERSPSWISATAVVEDLQEIPHDQLSDIPEEGAATPKSADTTVTEDIVEQTSEAVTCLEQEPELSVAEVTVKMIPDMSGEKTPVPHEPEPESLEVLQEAVELVNELPSLTSVEITEVQLENAASIPEPTPPIEFTESESKVVLMVHKETEATAICTGLGTKEIAKVAVEKPVIPTVECLAEISDALSAELPVEDKADPTEAADFIEEPMFEAQVEQVESTFLETSVEKTIEDIPEPEIATEGKEPEVEKLAVINDIQTEAEIIEAPVVTENTPRVELVDPITPTVEESIAADIVEISEEPVVEVKSEEMEVEETAAIKDIAPVEEVNEPIAREMATSLTDFDPATVTEVCEAAIAVVAPAEEFIIVKETVCLISPPSVKTQQVEVPEAVVVETVSVAVAEPAGDYQIQVKVTEVGVTEAEQTKEAETMEERGLVIAQVVILNAVEKVSEAEAEPESPACINATVTPEDALPVQAVAMIEKEIEQIAEEKPVIAETPVVQVRAPAPETPAEEPAAPEAQAEAENPPNEVHEAVQVIETIPVIVEITESIMEEVNKEAEDVVKEGVEEIKQEVELKQAVEVNISEEKVVEVEVVVKLEQTESESYGKVEEEIKKVKSNVEAVEVQEVLQAEVIKLVQEVIAEVPVPEAADEKSEAAVVTEETPVPEGPTETPKAPAQPKETTAEVVGPHTVHVVNQAAQIIEEKEAKEIQMEEVVEIDPIVSAPGTKEALAKEVTPAPESTPDTPAVTASQEAPANIVEEEVAVAMAVTVARPAEAGVEKAMPVKRVEVMAQVIEVIEEAVREIEPVSSTELTATS
ncbi:A-kinase anchor protein 12b isoform X1 [Salvelinus fontinalis]|uniref:A-kinase anchor protein 12b isoform X1 n=1 Tax=Salvelinus fontinalis TaxID=8038 RepID=UPI002485AEC8|nr:A-kinase anchor protein 12b isoform X1 [Salvelinus fontinalis]